MSFLPAYCFASINMMSMVLPCSFVIITEKAYNIYDYNTSLVFHLESSNENLKQVWSQSDSNESDIYEEQMSQTTNSNSASVIVAGLIGVTGSRVTKFGYKEFPVKDQRLMVCMCRMYRNCSKRIQDKVNVTSAFTK